MTSTSVRDLPRGHYAIPICECGPPYECVGYKLYERKVARTYKNGRTVGRDRLVGPRLLCLEGIDRQRFDQALDDIGQLGRWSDPDIVQSEVELLAEFPIEHQQEFGRFTGRCGCCGRHLTDPDSKMRGIGPECAKRGVA